MSYLERSWLPLADRRRGKLLLAALVSVHVAVVPAFVFVRRVGQPRYFGFFVVIALAILLFDLLLVATGRRRAETAEAAEATTASARVETLLDLRVVSIVLAAAVVVFVTTGLGLPLYLVMTVFFTMLLVRAFVLETAGEALGSLALVVLGSFLLLAAQLSSFPYFVRTADTIFHTTVAFRLSFTGFLETSAAGRYGDLPVFHSVMASMIQVAGQRSRLFVGVVVAALLQVAVVAFYVLLRKFGEPVRLSVAGALLMGISSTFLYWGTQNHAQSLSFFFLVLFLVGLAFRYHDRRNTPLMVVVVVTWVLTHQLSLLMSIAIMAVPVAASYLYANVERTPFEMDIRTVWYRYSILVAVLITYWAIVTRILWEPISWLLFTSPSAQGVASRGYLIEVYEDLGTLFRASLVEVVDKSHYVVWLALAALGCWTAIRVVEHSDRYRLVALLSFFPAAVVFFPNPAWIPLRGTALLLRWGIIALPFVALFPAIGLRRLFSSSGGGTRTVLVVLLVGALVFLSIGSGMSTPNTTDIAGYEKGVPKYLSEPDLAATDHVFAYTNDTRTYGTSVIPFYLTRHNWRYDRRPGKNAFIGADLDAGEIRLLPGLNVVQKEQMESKNARMKISDDPTVLAPVSAETVAVNETQGSRVYDANATEIYYRPAPAGAESDG